MSTTTETIPAHVNPAMKPFRCYWTLRPRGVEFERIRYAVSAEAAREGIAKALAEYTTRAVIVRVLPMPA